MRDSDLVTGRGLWIWNEAGRGMSCPILSLGLGAMVVLASLEDNDRVIRRRWFNG